MQLNDRYWRIQYGPLSIGLLDEHTAKFLNTSTKVLPISPNMCYPSPRSIQEG